MVHHLKSIRKHGNFSSTDALSRTPEEAISDGRLTPAHLQILSGSPDRATDFQSKLLHDTLGASSLPLVPERDGSAVFKPLRHYSLPSELQRNATSPQECLRNLSLPLELPERNTTLPLEPLKDLDFSLPFRRSQGTYEQHLPSTHKAGLTQAKNYPKNNARRRRKGLLPEPPQTLRLDNVLGVSLRGNRGNRFSRSQGRPVLSGRLGIPFKPSLPAADSPHPSPSESSDNDTVQLDASQDSSTQDFAHGCTTEEDLPQEKLTPDVSAVGL